MGIINAVRDCLLAAVVPAAPSTSPDSRCFALSAPLRLCACLPACRPPGEFCIVPCPAAAGGHKLVIDNNSGTYAPRKAQLGLMAQLFRANFADMTVETVAVGDPKLQYYQSCCPSRAAAPA